MSEQFKIFLSQLSETNATLDYFTDFNKIRRNVNKIAIKLNQLNYLIGKNNLKEAIEELFQENPNTFNVLNILIAIRENKKARTFNNEGQIVMLDSFFESPEMILEYIEETGLAQVFKNKDVTNLIDYVFGVEVGLDTNARKNRGGESMSKAVSLIFDKAKVMYQQEVKNTIFPEIICFGADVKRFDFVVKTKRKTYLIETNYYNTGGSKLNEVARAYSNVATEINKYENFEFVWITDGRGWNTAKNQLEEAFNIIPSVYNLTTLENFTKKVLEEGVITF